MPNRRQFLAAAVVASLGAPSFAAPARRTMTIQDVIDLIAAQVPGGRPEGTVDTVKSGDPSRPVTGIATTFLATEAVIRNAIRRGANLVVAHEPTYYNHRDDTDWLQHDDVYLAKRRLLEENEIVVWRFHDLWHRHRPDGIATGTLKLLGWEAYAPPGRPDLCTIPGMRLDDLAGFLISKFGTALARVMGDPDLVCRDVALLVGAWGGRRQIETLRRDDVQVLVCGEVSEWETPEWVRDAIAQGRGKALVVLGHALSEEPGMAHCRDWLQALLPSVPVVHLPSGDPFRYL